MSSVILKAAGRPIMALMLVFSVFLLLRGHNAPGGGFVGGLVAAAAFALMAMAEGATAVRRTLKVDPRSIALVGVTLAALSGLVALVIDAPYLTGTWLIVAGLPIGTPLLFDVGVYLVVVGSVLTLILALEEEA
jgi:multicomponent Na+:H+ antiporter subunit B